LVVVTASGAIKATKNVSQLLLGSWNDLSVVVPSGQTGSQVAVEVATSGPFTANVDSINW